MFPGLSEKTGKILQNQNINSLTEVQQRCLKEYPRNDIIVQAPTGTGKTLAYLLPIIERVSATAKVLIVAPTRELALQIHNVAANFQPCALFIGGADDPIQCTDPVIVSTPGRLLHNIITRRAAFKDVKYLILDEADKLLGLGFKNVVLAVARQLPQTKNALVSATMDSIADISKMVLRNPVRIRSDQGLLLDLLYVECTPMRKLEFLFLLNGRCVVFFATCAEVDFFYSLLMVNREGDACTYGKIDELKKDKNKNELKKYEKNDQNEDKPTNELKKDEQNPSAKAKTPRLILKLHSKMLQTERTEIYRKIESKETFILLCTDIAARGLDFEIDRVVHFDIPHEPQTLTHRSGRAARNGRRGEAILLLMKNEMPFLNYLAQKDLTASAFDFSFKDPDYSDLRHESLLAVKAFVAYIRSYKEYQLSFIFRYQELDFDSLAKLYFLEKIPAMDELRTVKFLNFDKPRSKNKEEAKKISIRRSKMRKNVKLRKIMRGKFKNKISK